MWSAFVELLRATIFGAAHVCGGSLGGGILLVSAAIRLALLPLTLRMARRAREQQARIAVIRPEVEAIQRRFANDPRRLVVEMQALHRQHGIRFVTPVSLAGMAIQLPVLSGLFAAVRNGLGAKVRFLWIADLARLDRALALGIAALSGWALSSLSSQPGQPANQTVLVLTSVGLTALFLLSSSAAVALSVGSGSLVSLLQNWIISRDAKARA